MKPIRLIVSLILTTSCGILFASPAAAVKHKCTGPCADNVPEPELAARVVSYDDKDVVNIKTKVRYTTLLVLPKNEQILDFLCGDKEYWTVNGIQNFASVKPAKAGSQTNLNLITASGNIYSFQLTEVSESPGKRRGHESVHRTEERVDDFGGERSAPVRFRSGRRGLPPPDRHGQGGDPPNQGSDASCH